MTTPGKGRPAWEAWYAGEVAKWKRAIKAGVIEPMEFDEWLVSFRRGYRSGLDKGGEKASGGSNFSAGQRSIPRRPSRIPNNLREMVEGR